MTGPSTFSTRVEQAGDVFGVHVNGDVLRTPGGVAIDLPTRALSNLIAAEWAAQWPIPDPRTMPISRLVNSAVERADLIRQALAEQAVRLLDHELLYLRAGPQTRLGAFLVQDWHQPLGWAAQAGLAMVPVHEGWQLNVPDHVRQNVRGLVLGLSRFELAAFGTVEQMSGSVLLSLGALAGQWSAAAALEWGHAEARFQEAQWGCDAQARQAMEDMRADARQVDIYLDALRKG